MTGYRLTVLVDTVRRRQRASKVSNTIAGRHMLPRPRAGTNVRSDGLGHKIAPLNSYSSGVHPSTKDLAQS